MKLYIIIGLVCMLLFVGCLDGGREKQEQAFAALQACAYEPGHHWDNDKQSCVPYPDMNGCKNLSKFEVIETKELPIQYENITDNYYNYDEGVDIKIFCTGWLVKNDNESCDVLYYSIRYIKRNSTLELCWR